MLHSNHDRPSRVNHKIGKRGIGRASMMMLAVLPVAAILAMPALGASLTWDPNLAGTGSDNSGNWDLTGHIWSNGASDVAWLNDGTSSAVFGVAAPATVTINTPNINAAGITFNQGYTINANGSDTLTLTGATPTIAVNSGSATINAVIAGTTGMTVSAAAGTSLTLGGNNTYSGGTTILGAAIVSTGSNLGAANNTLTFGTTD